MRSKLIKAFALASSLLLLTQTVAMGFDMTQTGGPSQLDNIPSHVVSLVADGGLLTLDTPTDVSLGEIIVSTADQTTTGEAVGLKMDDARGDKPSNAPGWSVTATMSDFSDVLTKVDALDELSVIDITNMTVAPNGLVEFNEASVVGVSEGSSITLADTGDDGVSDAFNWVTASETNGRGRYEADVSYSLVVPANSDAADYSSDMVVTIA